jgi:integrase
MHEAITSVEQGRFRYDQRQTVESYLNNWLEVKARQVRVTTLRGYRHYVLEYLVPQVGHIRLRDLRTAHVSQMLREITAAGTDAKGAVGPTTIRRIHSGLRTALTDARKEGLVQGNAARDAYVPPGARPKVDPWGPEELGMFLDHANSDRFGPIFELIALTGLRRGEALGLRWSDVDIRYGYIVIRQQIVQVDAQSFPARSAPPNIEA